MVEPIRRLKDERVYENEFLGARMDLFFEQIKEGGVYERSKYVYGLALVTGFNRILKSDGSLEKIKSEEDFEKLLPPKSGKSSWEYKREDNGDYRLKKDCL